MPLAYIGLGSNLEDPLAQVQQAVQELRTLPHSLMCRHSSWYRSRAVGPGDQPDYINGVAELETELAPERLLDELQCLEQAHRRMRLERWGPRTLDLDILLYDRQVLDTERLQVPHPWLKRRNFVVLPLAEVAPELILPDGTAVTTLANAIGSQDIRRLND